VTANDPDSDVAPPNQVAPSLAASKSAPIPAWMFALTVLGSLCIGFGLFVALPNVVAYQALKSQTDNAILLNLVEGVVKIAVFVAYIWVIGRKPDIHRIFEYHGAEHKVVYAVENGRPLTPEGARPFDTPHPRCGTGFALLTVLVSVICFSFLPVVESSIAQVAMRFALMPLVAGISYEIIKLTTHPRWGSLFIKVMTPGLWLQRLTTFQPDDAQLEVSCAAMRVVVQAEDEYIASSQASTQKTS
jgi:uncharacterized protein YqhQ